MIKHRFFTLLGIWLLFRFSTCLAYSFVKYYKSRIFCTHFICILISYISYGLPKYEIKMRTKNCCVWKYTNTTMYTTYTSTALAKPGSSAMFLILAGIYTSYTWYEPRLGFLLAHPGDLQLRCWQQQHLVPSPLVSVHLGQEASPFLIMVAVTLAASPTFHGLFASVIYSISQKHCTRQEIYAFNSRQSKNLSFWLLCKPNCQVVCICCRSRVSFN